MPRDHRVAWFAGQGRSHYVAWTAPQFAPAGTFHDVPFRAKPWNRQFRKSLAALGRPGRITMLLSGCSALGGRLAPGFGFGGLSELGFKPDFRADEKQDGSAEDQPPRKKPSSEKSNSDAYSHLTKSRRAVVETARLDDVTSNRRTDRLFSGYTAARLVRHLKAHHRRTA